MNRLNLLKAKEFILQVAAKGSSSSPLSDGRKQMSVDKDWLIDRLCRRDATGKISIRDREIVLLAIAGLERDGILDGELNGYPLMVNRGYAALRGGRGQTNEGGGDG